MKIIIELKLVSNTVQQKERADARCLCSYCEILNTQGLCYILIVKFEKKILATKNKTRQVPFSMSKN